MSGWDIWLQRTQDTEQVQSSTRNTKTWITPKLGNRDPYWVFCTNLSIVVFCLLSLLVWIWEKKEEWALLTSSSFANAAALTIGVVCFSLEAKEALRSPRVVFLVLYSLVNLYSYSCWRWPCTEDYSWTTIINRSNKIAVLDAKSRNRKFKQWPAALRPLTMGTKSLPAGTIFKMCKTKNLWKHSLTLVSAKLSCVK